MFTDLQFVCRDAAEGMTLDSATGEVLFHKNPALGTPSQMCTVLAQSSFETVIIPRFGVTTAETTQIVDSWVPRPPAGVGGGTHPLCSRGVMAWPSAFSSGPTGSVLARIDVLYDATVYPSGKGYMGHDASNHDIPVAPMQLLAFGMGSAAQIALQFDGNLTASASTPWTVDAPLSLNVENFVRREIGARERVGPLELYIATCSEKPGKVWTSKTEEEASDWVIDTRGTCFVATAAYGSPLAPEVQKLREFRDEVLRRTRAGAAWFERFYEHYDEVSRPIADRMRADPELADFLRIGIVQPYVAWLELAMEMPEARLDDVPEPWREFLALMIDRMDAWALEAMPDDLDGLSGLEAAKELAVVLRFGFRDHPHRSEYLDRLTSGGALPLRLSDDEAEEAREILLGAGLPAEDVGRVFDGAIAGSPR